MASALGGLLRGFNQGRENRRANRALDISQQGADTNQFSAETNRFRSETERFRAGTADRTQQETARHNANADRIKTLDSFSKAITDRDLPDAVRIKAQNDLNNFMGISGQVLDIADVDKAAPVLKKITNTKARMDKGEISQKQGIARLRGLEAEYKAALGESDAFEGEIKALAESDKANFDRDATEMARIFAKNVGGDTSLLPEDSASMANIMARFANDPEGLKNLTAEAKAKIPEILQSQGGGGDELSNRNANVRIQQLTRRKAQLIQKGEFLTLEEKNEIDVIDQEIAAGTNFKRLGPEENLRKKFAEKTGAGLADENLTAEDDIRNADQSDRVIDRGLAQLDAGIFSGAAANVKLQFNKYLREAGVNLFGETIENTETFAINMARAAAEILKSRILGSGTAVSDEDRKFALRLAAADITLDEKSLRRLLNMNKLINKEIRARANQTRSDIEKQVKAGTPFIDLTPAQVAAQRKRDTHQGISADQLKQKLLGNE